MRSNLDSSSRESANPPSPRAGGFSLAGRVDGTTGAEGRECFVPDGNACEAAAADREGEHEVDQNLSRFGAGRRLCHDESGWGAAVYTVDLAGVDQSNGSVVAHASVAGAVDGECTRKETGSPEWCISV